MRRDGRLLAQKPSPQTRDCWLAFTSLSIRRTKGQRFRGLLPRRTHSSRLTSYPSQCRPPYTRQLKFTQTEGPPMDRFPRFAFRCYVLSAGLFSELGLLDRARECLGGALETIKRWSPTAQASGDP